MATHSGRGATLTINGRSISLKNVALTPELYAPDPTMDVQMADGSVSKMRTPRRTSGSAVIDNEFDLMPGMQGRLAMPPGMEMGVILTRVECKMPHWDHGNESAINTHLDFEVSGTIATVPQGFTRTYPDGGGFDSEVRCPKMTHSERAEWDVADEPVMVPAGGGPTRR